MTQALSTLLQHVEAERDRAQAALLHAEDAVRRLEQQAVQLQSYRQDSLQRHPAQGGRSASIELLRCHQGFMQRLDQAIAQQHTQLQAGVARTTQKRIQLVALETRAASVRKLIERRGLELRQREAQREQRRQDDGARHNPLGDSSLARGWRVSTQTATL